MGLAAPSASGKCCTSRADTSSSACVNPSSPCRVPGFSVRLHPEVALYLLEEEPRLIPNLGKATGLELELRDDPMMRLDEFRLMSRPGGRDVTELYAVA